MSKGQPSQSTMRHDERKGPNRVRAHRSRDTGARRSCARSTPDQSPRPHPGLSDRRLRCTLGRRDRVRPLDTRGNNQPTVGRVRLVHNNRPTGVDHSSHGVPMQIASIMLRGPAEAGRQRLVGVGCFKTDSTNPWRFTDRLDPERRRRPASIDPRSRLSSFDTTTTSRDQQFSNRPRFQTDRPGRLAAQPLALPLGVWRPVPTAPKRRRTTWATGGAPLVDVWYFRTSSNSRSGEPPDFSNKPHHAGLRATHPVHRMS